MLNVISKKVDYSFSSTQISLSPALANRLKHWGYDNIAASDVYKEDDIKGRENDIHVF